MTDLENLQKLIHFKSGQLSDQHVELFFSYILEHGYLSYSDEEDSFRIPNNEIKTEFAHILTDFYIETYQLKRSSLDDSIKAYS